MKKNSIFLLLFGCLSFLFVNDTAAQKRVARYEGKEEFVDDNELRILSYNIQMLPRMLFRLSRGPIRRAKLIPAHLINDQIDIIVFQEAFDPRARRILKKRLKDTYPYMVGPANRAGFRLKTNSGVWIVSKIPIKELEQIDYKDCKADDCLARKGALLVEAEWHGVPFQVLGTHLNAGGPEWIRLNQYKEIRDLIDRHKKENVPQFLCGDFNTARSQDSLYQAMVHILDTQDGSFSGNLVYTDDPVMNDMNYCSKWDAKCEVIDYIFYRHNGHKAKSTERHVRQYQERWSEKYKDLSDHNAVLMRVQLK